ncbi:MAG: MFS transporter [Actinobacteria bacterium]|nr:MFS transporter [Actinomycetota bacterium]
MTPLWTPGFRRLLAAQWTSTAGDSIALVALPFAILALGGSALQVAIALAARIVSLVVLVLAGGVIADRLERRTVMIAADLVRFAAQAAIAVLLICGAAGWWQLLVSQALVGAGSAFFFPAMSGLLPELVGPGERQGANALSGLAGSSATMLGFALAGAAIAALDPGGALALDAFTFAASAALLRGIPSSAGEARGEEGRSFLAELVEGWGEFRRLTWLWVVVLEFGALNALVFGPFEVLGPLVAERSLGGAGAWALILAGSGVGALAGGIAALRLRPRRPLLLATALVACWAAPLALLAGGASATAIAVAAVPAGGALAIFEALWQTAFQDNVAAEQISRLAAYDWLGSFAMLPLGYLLAGLAEARVGVGPTLWAAAAIVVVATAVVTALPCVRELRGRRAPRGVPLPSLPGSAGAR